MAPVVEASSNSWPSNSLMYSSNLLTCVDISNLLD
jgi:hypothetical protein